MIVTMRFAAKELHDLVGTSMANDALHDGIWQNNRPNELIQSWATVRLPWDPKGYNSNLLEIYLTCIPAFSFRNIVPFIWILFCSWKIMAQFTCLPHVLWKICLVYLATQVFLETYGPAYRDNPDSAFPRELWSAYLGAPVDLWNYGPVYFVA